MGLYKFSGGSDSYYNFYSDKMDTHSLFSTKLFIFILIVIIGYWNNHFAHKYMPKWKKKSRNLVSFYKDHIELFIYGTMLYYIANYRKIFTSFPSVIVCFIIYIGGIYAAGTIDIYGKKFFDKHYKQKNSNINVKQMTNVGRIIFVSIILIFLIYLTVHIGKFGRGTLNPLIYSKWKYGISILIFTIISLLPASVPNFKGMKLWFLLYVLLMFMRSSSAINVILIGLVGGFFVYFKSKHNNKMVEF